MNAFLDFSKFNPPKWYYWFGATGRYNFPWSPQHPRYFIRFYRLVVEWGKQNTITQESQS